MAPCASVFVESHTWYGRGRTPSFFGIIYEYTSTHSQIASAFARTSFGADHHRIVAIAAFGHIENDYEDYLGTGQPLKTEDDLKAPVARYLFRANGDWFIGTQGSAANYQVLGATAEDDLVLEVEERLSFNARWGATLFAGAAALYGDAPVPLDRSTYPIGAGLHFVIKPAQRMLANLEYAQGIGDRRDVYLKLGYAE